jgi:hypothetical protein
MFIKKNFIPQKTLRNFKKCGCITMTSSSAIKNSRKQQKTTNVMIGTATSVGGGK